MLIINSGKNYSVLTNQPTDEESPIAQNKDLHHISTNTGLKKIKPILLTLTATNVSVYWAKKFKSLPT